MTCEEANALLLDELAGRVDDGRREDLHEHLAGCAACRETAAAQSDVSRVLASRPETEVRADFAARLARELAQESGWFGLADWRWLSMRLAPVAALLLLAAGLVIGRQQSPASPQASLSTVVETWASGGTGGAPVTSVLWQEETSEDAALLTVLAAPSDSTIVGQTDER